MIHAIVAAAAAAIFGVGTIGIGIGIGIGIFVAVVFATFRPRHSWCGSGGMPQKVAVDFLSFGLGGHPRPHIVSAKVVIVPNPRHEGPCVCAALVVFIIVVVMIVVAVCFREPLYEILVPNGGVLVLHGLQSGFDFLGRGWPIVFLVGDRIAVGRIHGVSQPQPCVHSCCCCCCCCCLRLCFELVRPAILVSIYGRKNGLPDGWRGGFFALVAGPKGDSRCCHHSRRYWRYRGRVAFVIVWIVVNVIAFLFGHSRFSCFLFLLCSLCSCNTNRIRCGLHVRFAMVGKPDGSSFENYDDDDDDCETSPVYELPKN